MTDRRPRARWLGVLLVAFIIGGPGGLSGPVSTSARSFDAGPWFQLVSDIVAPYGSLLAAISPTTAISKGTDNRLTIMLVGSDYRPRLAGTGERTDAIMFLTIDNAKHISAVSLPRDVGNVPISPSEIYKPKINGLFKHYKQIYGTREASLEHMRTAFQYTFGIQIDYVGYIRFTGVDRLVDNVAGIPTAVPYDIFDPTIVDDRTSMQHGAKFLTSAGTLMLGSSAPICYTVGNPINWNATPACTRALLYVRSRHGPGNNDWRRAKRQQSFVMAGIRRVISRGSGSNLTSLRSAALSNSLDFYTSLPTDVGSVSLLYSMLSGSSMPNQAVLQPPTYASTVAGTSKQQLKLDVVRALMHSWFGPL